MTRTRREVKPSARELATAAEGKRLRGVYSRYGRSRRRRRAWSAANPGNAAIRAELRSHILELAAPQLESDGEVLDVGCGGGWWLAQLAGAGVAAERLHGVELIEPRVAEARRVLPGADIRCADARRLPFADRRFDLVLMFTVLSSMPDRPSIAAALAEARRVLAPGGLLLCYEPRLPNPLNRATRRVPRRLLRAALGPESGSRTLTVLPPLARRLGKRTASLYPALARVPALRTHRLSAHAAPGD